MWRRVYTLAEINKINKSDIYVGFDASRRAVNNGADDDDGDNDGGALPKNPRTIISKKRFLISSHNPSASYICITITLG